MKKLKKMLTNAAIALEIRFFHMNMNIIAFQADIT